MIPEIFLTCALSLPIGMVPSQGRHYDVSIFKFMTKHYRKFKQEETKNDGRIYMLGGDQSLLYELRKHFISSYRITIEPSTSHDIVAWPAAIPLKKDSAIVVIFMWEIVHDRWGSMRLWSEATRPLAMDGIIAFYKIMSPHFSALAKAQGYEKFPFEWYEMELWRKPRSLKPLRILQEMS